MAIERRRDRDRRARSAASCTPRARATTRSPPTWRCSPARTPRRAVAALDGADGARWSTPPRPPRLAAARLHAPAARAAGLPLPPPARLRLDARSATARGSRLRAEQPAALPLGAGALAGRELRHRPRRWSPTSSASQRVAPNSIDAVSNRDFVLDFLAAAATCATHLSRLGAEIVLWSSEEFGFVRALRRLGVGLVDHAPEEEPRRGRAAAGQGAAGRRPPRARSTACMHAPPADLQQGHAGGQGAPLRRGRHARAVPAAARGMLDGRDVRPRAAGRGRRRRADRRHRPRRPARQAAACRSARPTASSPASCARRSTAAGAVGLLAEELASHSERSTTRSPRCSTQRSWLESKVSEGGTALARVREQLEPARAAARP